MATPAPHERLWGTTPYWGISPLYDPQWLLTPAQIALQQELVQLCRTTLRPNAEQSDKNYIYPRANFGALAKLGLLGLIVPKEFGGRGESHICAAMVCETIARYGCASTAMCYVMHLGAVAAMLFRHHGNPRIAQLLGQLDSKVLIGTLSYSDPATGGHFWFPMSSKVHHTPEGWRVLKAASWTTSAGYADWYVIQTTSPEFKGNYGNLSCYFVLKDEVRAEYTDWSALGLHGNQSGAMLVDELIPHDRLIGAVGDGAASNDEIVDPFFLLLSSAVWNGLTMGCIDIAKKHTTQKRHADAGMRVCDYPTIQDYVGEAIIDTNAARAHTFLIAQALDAATGNMDWSRHADPKHLPRSPFLHWLWQIKFTAAKNVTLHSDKMLHACGGSAYKTDLGLERYLRDGKAGWVMGPSNELLRQWVGKSALLGMEALDHWHHHANERVIATELKKLDPAAKRALAKKLLQEAEQSDAPPRPPNAFRDFDNPFHSCSPSGSPKVVRSATGSEYATALSESAWVALALEKKEPLGNDYYCLTFRLPSPSQVLGCLPGQFVQVRVHLEGTDKPLVRYFSPVSPPDALGSMSLVTRIVPHGSFSLHLQRMQPGESLEFRGPLGGFEYKPSMLKHLVLIAGGAGVTPCLQLIRCIVGAADDTTTPHLFYCTDTPDQLLFKAELDGYAASKRLHSFYTVRDATPDWQGGVGYLTKEMLCEQMPPPAPASELRVVLCGGSAMVLSVSTFLAELGYSSDCIFVYGSTGDELIRSIYGRNALLSTHTT